MPKIHNHHKNFNHKHQDERFQNRQALKEANRLAKIAKKEFPNQEPQHEIIQQAQPFRTNRAERVETTHQQRSPLTLSKVLPIACLTLVIIGAISASISVSRKVLPEQPRKYNNSQPKSLQLKGAHPDFIKAENKPGFGDGPFNPFSPLELGVRKFKGQMSTETLSEVKKMTSTGGFTSGNAILVTKDATETTRLRMKMIREAKQSIEISGNFAGGEILLETIDELHKALEKNTDLKVHLIFSDDLIRENDLAALKDLEKSFPDRVHYQITARHATPLISTVENHVKLTVVDGKYMIVGGTGIADSLVTSGREKPPEVKRDRSFVEKIFSTGARDQDSVIVGPMAQTARAEFFKLLRKWEGVETKKEADLRWFPLDTKLGEATITEIDASERLDRGAKIKLYTCSPEAERNPCTDALVDLIMHGEEGVTLAHMNQNYVRGVRAALDERLQRGSSVRVVTIGGYTYSELAALKVGVNIVVMDLPAKAPEHPKLERYFYAVEGVMYHKKLTLSQGKEETCYALGSYNLAKKSHSSDDEIMIVACHPKNAESKGVRQVLDSIEEDIALSRQDLTTGKVMESWSLVDNTFAFLRASGRTIKGALLVPEILGCFIV